MYLTTPFTDVMEVSQVPVIASHSSARHFTPGFERNMGDEMIQKLAENEGVIMINFGGSFVDQDFREGNDAVRNISLTGWQKTNSSRNDPEATEYILRLCGRKQSIPSGSKSGPDHFDHIVGLVGIDHLGFGSDFDGVGDTLPTGLKDVSMYPNLIAELLKRGYSKEDIEKVCYKNVFRVWKEVEEFANASS